MTSVLLCYLAAYDDLEGAVANNPGPLDLDEPDEKGWTPVMHAAARNRREVVSWLHARGADVRHAAEDGLTCVHLAAVSGFVQMLKLLIRLGCDLDVDHLDRSALESITYGHRDALCGGHLECARLLVLHGATVAPGYVADGARGVLMGWAMKEMASHEAPVTLAIGAMYGRDGGGRPCILTHLDGALLSAVAEFLRRPRVQVRRIERAMFVWAQEKQHEESLRRAPKRRKCSGRAGRGLHVF